MYCNTKTNNDIIDVSLVLQAPKTDDTNSILKTAFTALEKKIEAESNYKLNSTIRVIGNDIYEFDSQKMQTLSPSQS